MAGRYDDGMILPTMIEFGWTYDYAVLDSDGLLIFCIANIILFTGAKSVRAMTLFDKFSVDHRRHLIPYALGFWHTRQSSLSSRDPSYRPKTPRQKFSGLLDMANSFSFLSS